MHRAKFKKQTKKQYCNKLGYRSYHWVIWWNPNTIDICWRSLQLTLSLFLQFRCVIVLKSVNHRGSYYWWWQVWTYTIHMSAIHSHCCCNVFTLFTWLHVSVTSGKSSAIALICHYIFPVSLLVFLFISFFFNFLLRSFILFINAKV